MSEESKSEVQVFQPNGFRKKKKSFTKNTKSIMKNFLQIVSFGT